MAKKELTLSEFREIIKEEALKLKKRIVLENEKKALMAELNTLTEDCGYEKEELEMNTGDTMDEANLGMIGRAFGHEGSYEAMITQAAKKYKIEPTPEESAAILAQIQAAKGEGYVIRNPKTGRLAFKGGGASPHGAGNQAGFNS